MKKIKITTLAFVCAICMLFGTMMFANANVVNAYAVADETPTFSATKVMISNSKDKMLLATAIKNYNDVYEIGYEFTNEVETVLSETKKYYSSISNGTTTLTAGDIFDEDWASEENVGMIIWEIDFEFSTKYEFKAYALVGARENGQIVKPATEVKVTQDTTTSRAYYVISNTDVDLRTAGESVDIVLPANFDGYAVKSANIGDNAADAEIINNGAKLGVAVDGLPRGKNKLSVVLEKDCASAIVDFDLTIADMVIKTKSDLSDFDTAMLNKQTTGKYYVLGADIDYASGKWYSGWPDAKGDASEFGGTLDGRGYKISRFNTRRGLVYQVLEGAIIQNIILDSPIVGSASGGSITYKNNGTIENCAIITRITNGEEIVVFSGIATQNNKTGVIKNCIIFITEYNVYDEHIDRCAITYSNIGTISNCYAVTYSEYFKYLYNKVTDNVYMSALAFFKAVKTLPASDGWNSYWNLTLGELKFNDNVILQYEGSFDSFEWVVKDGVSEYSILTPDTLTYEMGLVVSELKYFFKQATNVELPVVTNSNYKADSKYISVGKTAISDAVSITKEEYGAQGFRIVTLGDDIIIRSIEDFGTLWGAYELMTRMFNYEYYAKDVFYIDKNVTDLILDEYDVSDVPDIQLRIVSDSQGYEDREVAHRMRQIEHYGEFYLFAHNAIHNSFYFVMDDLDSKNQPIVPSRFLADCKTQLCYTGHGDESVVEEMLDRSVDYIAWLLKLNPKYRTNSDILFGVQDENGWCSCSSCQKVISKYGAKSATMILYVNRLRDKLDTYLEANNIDREINLYYTSYFEIVQPPVHKDAQGNYVANAPELVLKDGVGVLFAPIHANFTKSIYDKENETTYEQLKSLRAISDRILVWTYSCNFMDFMAPFDSITNMPDWFSAIVDNGGVFLFNEGRRGQGHSSGFDVVRQYLVAKLEWDVDADVDALTEQFFEGYFGKAKEPMRQFYNELRVQMRKNHDENGMPSYILSKNTNSKACWPESLLNKWMGLINEAYELAGDDEELRIRILLESIFVRYYLIKLYKSNDANVETLKAEVIADAKAVGIITASAHRTVDQMFDPEP